MKRSGAAEGTVIEMERKLYIGGRWQDAANGETAEIRDPATGELVGTSAIASAEDVDLAVAAAKAAFPAWAALHPDQRARIMHRAADLIMERIDAIAELLTREQGKPVPDSRKEIAFGVEVIRYYAEEGRRVNGSIRPASRSDIRNLVISQPLGVVAGSSRGTIRSISMPGRSRLCWPPAACWSRSPA